MNCENIPHNFESDISELVNQFYGNSNEFAEARGNDQTTAGGNKQRSVLRCKEKGDDLVKVSERTEKVISDRVSGKKSMAALKSHSEAERRRRERINGHLTALRDFVPNSEKMEKAALLAEVIDQVKQLREKARRASQGLNIPMDTDELEVQELKDHPNLVLKASLCCNHRSGLLSEVGQAITSLPHVQILKSTVSTLGCRVKIMFLITAHDQSDADKELIVGRVRTALGSILDKVSAQAEYDLSLLN